MKKLVLGLVLTFSLLTLGNAYAQEWTWSDPSPVTSPLLKEIAANPVTGEIYGIDNAGLLVMPVGTGTAVTGLSQVPGGSDSVVNDIAVASTGAIFICTESFVKERQGSSFVAMVQQPRPPEDTVSPEPEDILQGKYTHIAVGQGGKLYVIYQDRRHGGRNTSWLAPPLSRLRVCSSKSILRPLTWEARGDG